MKQEFLDETDLKLLDALQHDATLSNVALAERFKISPPTCLRRVKRLTDEGWIERQIAVLSSDKLGEALGHGLTALVEVTLDAQGAEHLDAFENAPWQTTLCSNVGACRRGLTLCWWCKRQTCPTIWPSRNACSRRMRMCEM